MADLMTQAKREAEAEAADKRFGNLLEALGGTATAKAVFGEPIERDGLTIVPVARVRFGVGGGGGSGPGRKKKGDGSEAEQSGYGHGGGVQAGPLGYIELSGGKASYRRIADPVRPMAIALLSPLVTTISFALAALVWARLRSLR